MRRREFIQVVVGAAATAALPLRMLAARNLVCIHCHKPIRLSDSVKAGMPQTHATDHTGSRGFVAKDDGSIYFDYYHRLADGRDIDIADRTVTQWVVDGALEDGA